MYQLSRLLLIIAIACGLYSLAVLMAITWPWGPLVGGLIVFLTCRKTMYRRLTTLGSARFAEEGDLRRAGFIGADTGLILGRLPNEKSLLSAIKALLSLRLGAREACRQFWAKLRGNQGEFIRLTKAVHTAVFSPTGGGKGVSVVLPFLFTARDSCVVVDFKGENAAITAAHRKQFGHHVVWLDPFRLRTQTPDTFNPLDFIPADSPFALDDCMELAKAIVVRPDDERDPHWNDGAESFIQAVIAIVVIYGKPEDRSLQTVRDIFSNPARLDIAIRLMSESDACEGMLKRLGGQLLNYVDKEKSSTLTTVSRHLRALDTLPIAESTRTSSFDPRELNGGKMSIFLTLPPQFIRSATPILRIWIWAMLRAVVSGGLQEERKVYFVLDETSSLGHLESLEDAVDKFRGYGVRLIFVWQSLGQVKKNFPKGQDITLLSNVTSIFFAVQDTETAHHVSTRLGDETIWVESTNSGNGTSWQRSANPQSGDSTTVSGNSGRSQQQQARRLLKPEEVIALNGRTAITFTPGVPPIISSLVRHYEERGLGVPLTGLRHLRCSAEMLLKSAAATLTMVVFGLVAAAVMQHQQAVYKARLESSPPAFVGVPSRSVPYSGRPVGPNRYRRSRSY